MNLSGRDKTILIVLGVILVIICYVEIFLMPMLDKISQVSQETGEMSEKLEKYTVTAEKYKSNQNKKDQLDKQVDNASEQLPGIAKEPEITYDIKSQADSAKVAITSVSFSGSSEFDPLTLTQPGQQCKIPKLTTPQGKIMNMSANVACNGPYSAILNFIDNIEKGKRIAEVQNISIGSSGVDKLQVSMSVNYYYIDNQKQTSVTYPFLKDKSQYGKTDMFVK